MKARTIKMKTAIATRIKCHRKTSKCSKKDISASRFLPFCFIASNNFLLLVSLIIVKKLKYHSKNKEWYFKIIYHLSKYYSDRSKVSINLVVKLPALKLGSAIKRKCIGMVVFIPSITNSLSARSIVEIASSLVCAVQINLAIIES